ncbi:MAG: flagellar filament capping protein FliD [Treponema sp.]|jgi:flagellar hook-associated protein 2|nr:flagellar filament capping protein FliD [Treponema sp.]
MSDIYVPGVKSRFNTEKMIDDLMKVERLPKERFEKQIENLQAEKTYWQDLGRRMMTLRDSARFLYSFQNPFNDRVVNASDASVMIGTATREAVEREYNFTVKQIAQPDRFLSTPLEDSFKVGEGTYTFSVGQDAVSLTFRGGSLREFTEALNRRGRDKMQASLIAVQRGKKSLLIESKIPGAENRLKLSGDAENLALQMGMLGQQPPRNASMDIAIDPASIKDASGPKAVQFLYFEDDALKLGAGGKAVIPVGFEPAPGVMLQFEIATTVFATEDATGDNPADESIAETVSDDTADAASPSEDSAVSDSDALHALSVTFSDGTSTPLPPIRDAESFSLYEYLLSDIAGDKTISSIELVNRNTGKDIALRNIRLVDPNADTAVEGGLQPLNPVSVAQDAVVLMEGIEIIRPTNTIDDLIPGVTITAKGPSDKPVRFSIEPDRESIKDAIIAFVGNYNRLMAEVNVLTRNDERVIQELTYLSTDEQADLKRRMGIFAGDAVLNQYRNTLQRAAAAPYPTGTDQGLALLSQIGIGTDRRGSGSSAGYDPARLRGYLEIDEKALDAALQTNLSTIQQLFGYDTNGDLIVDSGVAYTFETLCKPYVEIGGVITLKTGTLDSKMSQEQRRIDTLDRQLAAKEASLKNQYGQMESAYNRMERMTSSLDQFSQQNNNNR